MLNNLNLQDTIRILGQFGTHYVYLVSSKHQSWRVTVKGQAVKDRDNRERLRQMWSC